MSAGGTTANVKLGPGRVWIAPIGTAAPTSASAAPHADFWALGYTEEGTTISIEYTSEDINVAEELDPIDVVNTARNVTLALQAAEVTRKRMAVSLSLGAAYLDDATVLDLPDADAPQVGVALIWDSAEDAAGNDQNIRWYIPKLLPTGTIEIARQKAPNKALLPMELKAVKLTGSPLLRIFPNANGLV